MTDKEDLQAASVANPSRRCLFKTAAVGAAGLAVGATGGYLVSQQSNTASEAILLCPSIVMAHTKLAS